MKSGLAVFVLLLLLAAVACSVWVTAGPGERVTIYGIDSLAAHAARPSSVQDALERDTDTFRHEPAVRRINWGAWLLTAVICLLAVLALLTPALSHLTAFMKTGQKIMKGSGRPAAPASRPGDFTLPQLPTLSSDLQPPQLPPPDDGREGRYQWLELD